MAALREREIVLEICPTSNLLTKALPDEDAVRDTFRTFSEHGVAFTIATDGPEMMQTHLRDEFDLLLRVGALDEDELRAANARAHDAAFVLAADRRCRRRRWSARSEASASSPERRLLGVGQSSRGFAAADSRRRHEHEPEARSVGGVHERQRLAAAQRERRLAACERTARDGDLGRLLRERDEMEERRIGREVDLDVDAFAARRSPR